MKLKREIVLFARTLDLDGVGFADVRLYRRVPLGSVPEEILPGARTAVVYLYTLEKLRTNYGPWYIVSLNNHISKTNRKLVELLEEKGYSARGVQENEYDRKTLVGKLSFRQMAALAGLGSIGKSHMLLHPELGPGVAIGTVLTNAKIVSDAAARGSICAKCETCILACPTQAIGDRFDRWRCKNRRKILRKGCGIPCVKRCPAALRGKGG